MISREMQNLMLKEAIINEIKSIKEEMETLKLELSQIKEVLRERQRA